MIELCDCQQNPRDVEVYYNMYNSGYRNKFSSVPRNISDASENLVSVTKYMKTLWSTEGPFPITQVHTNGTVTISLRPEVTERINI